MKRPIYRYTGLVYTWEWGSIDGEIVVIKRGAINNTPKPIHAFGGWSRMRYSNTEDNSSLAFFDKRTIRIFEWGVILLKLSLAYPAGFAIGSPGAPWYLVVE